MLAALWRDDPDSAFCHETLVENPNTAMDGTSEAGRELASFRVAKGSHEQSVIHEHLDAAVRTPSKVDFYLGACVEVWAMSRGLSIEAGRRACVRGGV